MITSEDLAFDANGDDEMIDDEGDRIFCDACEAPATQRVAVSEEGPHDSMRNYCETCCDVYMVGVQHGRHHEAAIHLSKPGRDSSQDPPTLKNSITS